MKKFLIFILVFMFILSGCNPQSMKNNEVTNKVTSKKPDVSSNSNNNTQETSFEPITVTYTLSSNNTIIFSENNIKLKIGQSLIVKKDKNIDGDTMPGGDFYKILDFDWEYSNEDYSTKYIFRGISEGNTIIEFDYTKNSQINGRLSVQVELPNEKVKNIKKPVEVYYNINSEVDDFEKYDAIEFTQKEITIEVGQKLILVPDESMQNLQLIPSELSFKELTQTYIYQLDSNKYVFICKALEPGKVTLIYNVAHEFFMKGSIDVTITK